MIVIYSNVASMSPALTSILQVSLDSIYWIPIYTLLIGMASIFWSPAGFRKTGPRPAGYLNIAAAGVGFLHSLLALVAIWGGPVQEVSVTWLTVADLQLILPLEYSSQTIGAIATITGLNTLAQLYAVGYLEMDWGWARFFASLSLFESGMCALALFNSLFFQLRHPRDFDPRHLPIGWDLVQPIPRGYRCKGCLPY